MRRLLASTGNKGTASGSAVLSPSCTPEPCSPLPLIHAIAMPVASWRTITLSGLPATRSRLRYCREVLPSHASQCSRKAIEQFPPLSKDPSKPALCSNASTGVNLHVAAYTYLTYSPDHPSLRVGTVAGCISPDRQFTARTARTLFRLMCCHDSSILRRQPGLWVAASISM